MDSSTSTLGIFVVFVFFIGLFGCVPPSPKISVQATVETKAAETLIESAFGAVERDEHGTIIGIDLARERVSATDEVLKAALSIPNLKRFRFAGGSVAGESLAGLKKQNELEELFLQDVPIRDDEWKTIIHGIPKLSRLTIRRLPNLSDAELGLLPERIPALRNLSLIELELSGESLSKISRSEILMALDVRHCGRLTPDDFRCLAEMKKLVDLKIGGFAVTDDVLTAIAPLQALRGLAIDDALVTSEGFERFASNFESADKLETLVLGRDMSLLDDSLCSLKKFPRLKRLAVDGLMLTGSFLERLAEEESTRPKLERLSLRKTFLTEEGARSLKKYRELRVLDLSGIAVTPEIVDVIVALEHLEELDVRNCGLDDDSLRRLQKIKRLIR